MISENNYINIQGWMRTELNLSGNLLLIYAIIYGFSQDGQSQFSNGIKYICDWLGCSKPTAINGLKKLCEMGLIERIERVENNVKYVNYVVKNFDHPSKKILPPPSKKILPPVVKNFNPIINILNKINNKELKESVERFIQHRKELKKPLTSSSLEYNLKQLDKWSNGDIARQIRIIEKTLQMGWVGLFEPKEDENNQPQTGFLDEMREKRNRELGL